MDVKLKVLGGAKAGREIPLKKAEFTIGRSSECTLRAGSDAISRKHCAIRLGKTSLVIVDLGSRNGTFVNEKQIQQETKLANGDEVRVGPLRFEVICEIGIDRRKKPRVQSVKQAVAQSAGTAVESQSIEDDIDDWLTAPASDTSAGRETTSLRMDETQGGATVSPNDASNDAAPVADEQSESIHDDDAAAEVDGSKSGGAEAEQDSQSSTIGNNRKDKKEPGKLPPRPKGPTSKDSREAASEVLRAMTRRR